MSDIQYRVLESFPEPAFTELAREAFADYEQSTVLAVVLDAESVAKNWPPASVVDSLRIGAFRDGMLVGWAQAVSEGPHFHMVNSGVAPESRRRGVYSRLAQMVLDHAKKQGYVSVLSRHTVHNNAVIIAKLKLGFFVSGFEYSEVYGPLVRLTYLPGKLRHELHQVRSRPIRRDEPRKE